MKSLIFIKTEDFKTFTLYEEKNIGDNLGLPREKIGTFTTEDLNGIGWNSEKGMSEFIANRYGYTEVYSLNDFREL